MEPFMRTKQPKVVDLFSGAGGLSLGAARAGFDVRGAVDTDPHALRAHKVNFTASRHLDVDVATLSGEKLVDLLELEPQELSGIVGGPPCQGFSSIGLRNRDDPRNTLFVDFFRIVSEVNPAFYLAENVPGILRPPNSRSREQSTRFRLEQIHYLGANEVISARLRCSDNAQTRVLFRLRPGSR